MNLRNYTFLGAENWPDGDVPAVTIKLGRSFVSLECAEGLTGPQLRKAGDLIYSVLCTEARRRALGYTVSTGNAE